MPLLNFGQPVDGVIQMAYVVPDLRRAMTEWTGRLKMGPWFLFDPFRPVEQNYRGQPTQLSTSIAMAFAGHIQFELIQQHNDVPSVYMEGVKKRGYGFHHWGYATTDFDRSVTELRAKGYDAVFTLKPDPMTRLAYMDSTADLPGYIELIEASAATEALFTVMYQAALGWDGKDPVRTLAPPPG